MKEKLTKAQKREFDLLRQGGGYCHVFDLRTLNVFRNLKRKGYVKIEAGYGQFQSGHHVSLIDQSA